MQARAGTSGVREPKCWTTDFFDLVSDAKWR